VTESDDNDLMTRVRDGDLGAAGELFDRHHAAVYRFCRRMTGSPQAAEDLVQDVFMKILGRGSTFRPHTKFVPWMYSIARNACIDHLRRHAQSRSAPEPPVEPPSDGPGPDRHVEGRESADLLRRALLRLPADRREVLLLSRFELKSYDEIARATDSTVGAVKTRAHRAVRQLRDVFRELAGEAAS